MFARQGIRSASRFGVRKASTASSVVSKVTGFANCSWYWTKVFGNVAKQIYIKEGLTPPNASEFRKVYDDAVKQGLLLVRDPKRYSTSLLRVAQTSTSGDYLKYGCYLIQILGFFALGEIVGRRKLAGYPDYGPKKSD
ncbi:hypothetical protein HII13_003597 [Brettanomyces bruxellensis]|uniref:DEBR0S3_12794g1_1 n=1 Tax=Dekkera bruxellensis TaxID=5007 RepID=A0A7D9D188_DEKBR|nr:hypothetical protein HII13_003597 [Brettanomyces bruxellensis]VUG18492.1 ATP20 [Brettanomyces bruxellensis]